MSSAREELAAFRQTHSVRVHVVGRHVWDVIQSGSGGRVIVVLPGGGGSAESQFQLIGALEGAMLVVAIGFPASLANVADGVSGIRAILDDAGVQTCFMLGHSLGGVFAQAFAASFPERVTALILANTALYSKRRAMMIRAALSSARRLPKRAIAAMLAARVKRLLQGLPDRDFWLEYFTHEELERVGRAGIANRGTCIADSVRYCAAAVYGGPTLILESGNETGFSEEERSAFKRLYPHAQMQTFDGAGHLSSITRLSEFVEAVREFTGSVQLNSYSSS